MQWSSSAAKFGRRFRLKFPQRAFGAQRAGVDLIAAAPPLGVVRPFLFLDGGSPVTHDVAQALENAPQQAPIPRRRGLAFLGRGSQRAFQMPEPGLGSETELARVF